jgi:hypothetical protein
MRFIPATLWLALMAWVGMCIGAAAQEHHHPPQDAEMHDLFYQHWMMPDDRSRSCCNKHDCAPAEARFDRQTGRWMAFSRIRQEWVEVPEAKIEHERDVPMGAHLCENSSGVLCFGVGTGG